MGDWWSSPPPFSTLTLHTRVLTSDSWPRRMRACFWCQLRNVKFRGSSDVRSNWLVKDQGRNTTLAIQVSLGHCSLPVRLNDICSLSR